MPTRELRSDGTFESGCILQSALADQNAPDWNTLDTLADCSADFSSSAIANPALAAIVSRKAAIRIAAATGSPGRCSPNAIMPPAIGTRFESAEDKGIVMMPRE